MLSPQRDFQRKLLTFLSPQHETLSAEDQMTLLVVFALPECQVCGRQLVLQIRPELRWTRHQSRLQVVNAPCCDMHGEVLIRGYRLVGRTRTLTGRPWRRRRLLPFGAGL